MSLGSLFGPRYTSAYILAYFHIGDTQIILNQIFATYLITYHYSTIKALQAVQEVPACLAIRIQPVKQSIDTIYMSYIFITYVTRETMIWEEYKSGQVLKLFNEMYLDRWGWIMERLCYPVNRLEIEIAYLSMTIPLCWIFAILPLYNLVLLLSAHRGLLLGYIYGWYRIRGEGSGSLEVNIGWGWVP